MSIAIAYEKKNDKINNVTKKYEGPVWDAFEGPSST
jgi:hypothetical protein